MASLGWKGLMAQVRPQPVLFNAMFIMLLHAATQSPSLTSSLNKEKANDSILLEFKSVKKHET